jgi:hypothetical protein
MKSDSTPTHIASTVVLIAGLVTLTLVLSMGIAPVSAFFVRHGALHLTKECSQYTGAAGSFCTFTASNLAAIPIGSKIFVDQPAGIPGGLLDSNVSLEVGTGDWAVGRCTLDLTTSLGLCTFWDGTGGLSGFHARVNVSPAGGFSYNYDGTYSFRQEPDTDGDTDR